MKPAIDRLAEQKAALVGNDGTTLSERVQNLEESLDFLADVRDAKSTLSRMLHELEDTVSVNLLADVNAAYTAPFVEKAKRFSDNFR